MFVLAHLSDPHLGPLPRPRLADLASKRLAGYLNWRTGRRMRHRAEVLAALVSDLQAASADHIAVTGDLTNIALASEFAPARVWLESLGPPDRVTVIPGNHDAYVRAASGFSALHWDAYMRGDAPAESAFPFVRRRGPVALVGLSTAVASAPFMATGRLGGEQRERLSQRLRELKAERLFRVVLIHHPPTGMRPRHKRLTDAAEFAHVIAAQGAELILHGHDHVHSLSTLPGPDGPVPVVGVPSASATDSAGYNLYRIAGEAPAWRCEMVARGLAPGTAGIGERGRQMLLG